MDKTVASKMNGAEILDAVMSQNLFDNIFLQFSIKFYFIVLYLQAISHIKTLSHKESKLDNLKTYYNVKVELKNLRLEGLKNDINAKKAFGRLTNKSDELNVNQPSTSGLVATKRKKASSSSNLILVKDDSDWN